MDNMENLRKTIFDNILSEFYFLIDNMVALNLIFSYNDKWLFINGSAGAGREISERIGGYEMYTYLDYR